jgi:hypothetical protein
MLAIKSLWEVHSHTSYRVFGDFMSIPQDLFLEAIRSQKCYVNMGPVLYDYGDMGI